MPKLVLWLRQYTFSVFLKDSIAGLTVGLVALPQAMAFGIASGVTRCNGTGLRPFRGGTDALQAGALLYY